MSDEFILGSLDLPLITLTPSAMAELPVNLTVPQTGPPGPVGPMGPAGMSGSPGPVGPMGAAGPPGPAGPQGVPGPIGATGLVGATGAGATGASGIQGLTGQNGATGSPGATGSVGAQGIPGIPGATGAPGFVPRSYIAGFTLSNDATSPKTILNIAAGQADDSTHSVLINGSAFKKTTAAFSAGNNNGGFVSGLIASAWYHVFAAIVGGAYDVFIDQSVTAANKPAGTTAFRRIGSIATDTFSNIADFVQLDDEFLWLNVISNVAGTISPNTMIPGTLSVPSGVQVFGKFRAWGTTTFGGPAGVLFSSLDSASTSFNNPNGNLSLTWNGPDQSGGEFTIRTNTLSQIAFYAVAQPGENPYVAVATIGWIDPRGKNL